MKDFYSKFLDIVFNNIKSGYFMFACSISTVLLARFEYLTEICLPLHIIFSTFVCTFVLEYLWKKLKTLYKKYINYRIEKHARFEDIYNLYKNLDTKERDIYRQLFFHREVIISHDTNFSMEESFNRTQHFMNIVYYDSIDSIGADENKDDFDLMCERIEQVDCGANVLETRYEIMGYRFTMRESYRKQYKSIIKKIEKQVCLEEGR